jgi:division protein CdvB (Snf7/Vps24/ESCRT-III family)
MGMLELLPQDKIKIKDNGFEYPVIDKTEAEKKVDRAIKGIADKKGLSLEDAFIATIITK